MNEKLSNIERKSQKKCLWFYTDKSHVFMYESFDQCMYSRKTQGWGENGHACVVCVNTLCWCQTTVQTWLWLMCPNDVCLQTFPTYFFTIINWIAKSFQANGFVNFWTFTLITWICLHVLSSNFKAWWYKEFLSDRL